MTPFKSDGQLLAEIGLFTNGANREGFFSKNFAGNLVNQNNNAPSPQNVLGNVLGLGNKMPGRP